MKKIMYYLIISAALLLLVSCSGKRIVYVLPELQNTDVRVEKLINPATSYGILVQNTAGDTVLDYHADKLMVPASTMKIVTAAAAWKFLGSQYRIPTYIGYDGFTNNNILFGNLVVTGTGDPTLDRRHWYDPEVIFSAWADSLKAHGISEIRGDIIGNDDLFEETHLGSGWAWDDLSFSYSAEFGPLMADNTTVEFFINPPENKGDNFSIMDNIPFDYFTYKNNVTYADSLPEHIHARRINGENILSVYGNYSEDKKSYTKMITADNPTLFYASLLKASLEKAGIAISGNPVDIDDLETKPENDIPVFTHHSPPLSLIIRQFLHDSNNQAGEALIRHLAWKETGFGSMQNGIMILEVFFTNVDISRNEYRVADACGLSRYNLFTPAAMNKILLYMNDIPEFRQCLSQPNTGTLTKRSKLADLDIFAKTGSMSRIDCITGYLKTARNKDLIFTIMINNYQPQKGNRNQTDSFLRLINHF
jgi:serine-type D-Ala-D-Ala carboxypeptidase/endopeptidase (penicillin-binding protein 4)